MAPRKPEAYHWAVLHLLVSMRENPRTQNMKDRSIRNIIRIEWLSMILFMSCSSGLKTFSEHAPASELQKFKTYAWAAPSNRGNNGQRNMALEAVVINQANEELHKKGMTIDVDKPQVILNYTTRVEDRMEYSTSAGYDMGYAYGGPGYYIGGTYPLGSGDIRSSQVEQGMLFFDMVDISTGKTVWSAGATQKVSAKTKVEPVVKRATKFIFAKLPIQHKN